MANPLPNEKEIYERIRNEKITVDPEIWDLLYNRIGDDITAINLLTQLYFNCGETVPIMDAGKILSYTRHIKEIVEQVTITSKDDFLFPEFINNVPLHPVVRDMFTHYIGNDVYMINLIVQDAIDPIAPQPLSLESSKKVISHAFAIREFMNTLRQATSSR